MTNTKTYFTNEAAREAIIDTLENEYDGYLCDLHHVAFNEGYYIIGRYEAENALEQYGVFNAIHEVMRYEEENFGQVTTEIHEPERLANALWYIVGENVMHTIQDDVEEVTGIDAYNDCIDEPNMTDKIVAAVREIDVE